MSWERCARLLMLCSPAELDALSNTIETIVRNIQLHPHEVKYRELKQSNSVLRGKVLDVPGGAEFLLCLGFSLEVQNEVKVFCYRQEDTFPLSNGLIWLSETIATCKEHVKYLGGAPTTKCAECILHIRLPNGATIEGGFSSQDTIDSVKSYVCTYYQQDRHASLVLKLPHTTTQLPDDSTLQQLDLVPRGTLVVRMSDDESHRLQEGKIKADVEQASKVQAAVESKAKLLRAREQEKIDRANTLKAFQEDRRRKR